MLIFAIVCISAALIFYTIGVWGERLSKVLMLRHLIMFWTGFICDTLGTTWMSRLASDRFLVSFHSVTGILALSLMAVHAVWATAVLIKGSDRAKRYFHKFSTAVWAVWLIPYISGMIYGMMK